MEVVLYILIEPQVIAEHYIQFDPIRQGHQTIVCYGQNVKCIWGRGQVNIHICV
jgi:hypothetical protein